MTDAQTTPEIDILVAAVGFLLKRSVEPYRISLPKGKGIDRKASKEQMREVLISACVPFLDVSFNFLFSEGGPDLIGISKTEWWQVECKGVGSGTRGTQRNNFDRVLASVVSYYCEEPEGLPKRYEHYNGARPYLGLALPASAAYLNELKKRVRQPLRKILNLWVLLYQPKSKSIEKAVSPDDSY